MRKFVWLWAVLAAVFGLAATPAFADTYLILINGTPNPIKVTDNHSANGGDSLAAYAGRWTTLAATVLPSDFDPALIERSFPGLHINAGSRGSGISAISIQDTGNKCADGNWDIKAVGATQAPDFCLPLGVGEVGCVTAVVKPSPGGHGYYVAFDKVGLAKCSGAWVSTNTAAIYSLAGGPEKGAFHMESVAYPGTQINNEHGSVQVGPTQPGWLSATWFVEPVSGTDNYRIKNGWTGTFMTASVNQQILLLPEDDSNRDQIWHIYNTSDPNGGENGHGANGDRYLIKSVGMTTFDGKPVYLLSGIENYQTHVSAPFYWAMPLINNGSELWAMDGVVLTDTSADGQFIAGLSNFFSSLVHQNDTQLAQSGSQVGAGLNGAFVGDPNTYKVNLGFCRGSSPNYTGATTPTLDFMVGARVVSSQTMTRTAGCYATVSFSTAYPIDTVAVRNSGAEAVFLSGIVVFKGGVQVTSAGGAPGLGWCVATGATIPSAWKRSVTGGACQASQTFSLPH